MRLLLLIYIFAINVYATLYTRDQIPYEIELYTKDTHEYCGYKAYYAAKYKFVPDDWVDKFGDGKYFRDGTPFLAHYFKCPDGWEGYEVWIIKNSCPAGKVYDFNLKACGCGFPLIADLGRCVPNPNLSKEECEEAGGIYMENSLLDTFSSIDHAIVAFYAPGPAEGLCYTQAWVDEKKKKLKAKLSPKNVILGAISLLPISRLGRLTTWIGTSITRLIEDEAETPALLLENKPVIEARYNKDTGVFEPVVEFKPREDKIDPSKLLNNPDVSSADDIITLTDDFSDFLRSKFAETEFETPVQMREAVVAYDLERGAQEGTAVKTIDDLRDIFSRSEVDTSPTRFPAVIDDYVTKEGTLPVEISRQVTPVSEGETKVYNVTYNITPEGTTEPVQVIYKVEVLPSPQEEVKNIVKATPVYQVGEKKVIGEPVEITKNITIINNYNNTTDPKETDVTTFRAPAENAIRDAFNYKIVLFPCPNASPECPHDIELHYSLAGYEGKFKIKDPLCAIIEVINKPAISPLIDKAGSLIVLFAFVTGMLSLVRRD